MKLELNACQESSHNFYIGTNNTQHLERELLSSKFHSIFLHNWLTYLDEGRNSQVSTIRQPFQHILSSLSHFQVYQSTGGKLFAHKMTLHDQRQRGAHCYTIQPSLHPLTHCGGPAGPQLGVMNRRMDVRGRREGGCRTEKVVKSASSLSLTMGAADQSADGILAVAMCVRMTYTGRALYNTATLNTCICLTCIGCW